MLIAVQRKKALTTITTKKLLQVEKLNYVDRQSWTKKNRQSEKEIEIEHKTNKGNIRCECASNIQCVIVCANELVRARARQSKRKISDKQAKEKRAKHTHTHIPHERV